MDIVVGVPVFARAGDHLADLDLVERKRRALGGVRGEDAVDLVIWQERQQRNTTPKA